MKPSAKGANQDFSETLEAFDLPRLASLPVQWGQEGMGSFPPDPPQTLRRLWDKSVSPAERLSL